VLLKSWKPFRTTDLVEIFDNPYRAQILDWINKEHLSPEIWDLKGLKNATKRFSTQLSLVKDNMIKIRAINSGLEEENRRLRDENANLSSELRDLKITICYRILA
jgi:predicted nuclease with TOPRIM domain